MSIVAKTYRGPLVDLTYIGHIAVVDYTGKILYQYGDPKRVTFARSSTKPMQAIPVLECGAGDAYSITDKEIALFCASHNGESFHVDTVRSILSKAGLDEGYLQCGTHYPFAKYVTTEMQSKGIEPETVHCNCSGKHSGMLITAKYLNEDLNTYYQSEHPVQKRIMKVLGEICDYDENEIITAIDGCGVPVHALPLDQFAQGYARMTKPELFPEERAQIISRITNAMTTYPEMVAGTDRICSELMQVFGDRLFAKSGADGYYAIGLKGKGIGITFKMEAGNNAVFPAVVLETLRQLEVISQEEFNQFHKFTTLEIKNHKKEIVGETKVEFTLIKNQ